MDWQNQNILNKNGINKQFRNKRLDNFDFSTSIAIVNELINHRYFNNLPIINSSECSVGRLLDIDEALGSRLMEMTKDRVVELRGKELNYRVYG